MNKIRMCFIDDDKYRHKIFNENTIGANVENIYTVYEALKYLEQLVALNKEPPHYIFLDHDFDFGDQNKRDGFNFDTGQKIVKYLTDPFNSKIKEFYKNTQFIIHSMNIYCGNIMHQDLINNGFLSLHAPAAWKYIKLNEEKQISDVNDLKNKRFFIEENR